MLKTAGVQSLLGEDNLITLERTAHAVRTCQREMKLEMMALDEGRLIRHAYELMLKSGLMGASYELILEKTREGLEAESGLEEQLATGTALALNDTSFGMRNKRFWWWLEQQRQYVIAVLFVLFVIMVGVVTRQIIALTKLS